jgi:glycolate oxidase iron-sulfur subunit
MAKMKDLQDYREEIEQCVKCGACRAHCPVFGVEKREGRVARGKIALAHSVLEGDIDLEAKVLEDMSQCLLCGSCCAQCPNKPLNVRQGCRCRSGPAEADESAGQIRRHPVILAL